MQGISRWQAYLALRIPVSINVGRGRGIAFVRRQSEPNIKNTLTWLYSGSFLERNGRVGGDQKEPTRRIKERSIPLLCRKLYATVRWSSP